MPSATETVAPASNANSRAHSTRSRAAPKRITVVEISQSKSKSAGLRGKDSTKASAAAKKASKIETSVSKTPAPKMATKRKASDLQTETTRKKAKTDPKIATAKVSVGKKVANAKRPVQKIGIVKPMVAKKPSKVEKNDNTSEPKVKIPKKVSSKPIAPTKAVPKRVVKSLQIINTPPSQCLDIYVFGEGSAGELGLGAEKVDGKSPVDVKRPRLNQRLSSRDVGIIHLAVGGMHCAALTHDNKILTWGVNDQGALGREAPQDGKMKELSENVDSDSDSDDAEESGLNPNEAEPREIDLSGIEEGVKFAGVFAGDSTTFALTTDGRVYGWGTFRGNDGVLGFRHDTKTQHKPMLIPELKNIVNIACGTNHVLALDKKGKVFTWGAGEQNQLARRVVSRTAMGALVPREFGLGRKKITQIGCGDYHSFAISSDGDVYSWGLNTFGQTGVPKYGLDEEDENTVQLPTKVESLQGFDIIQITGGAHHTLACTATGQVLIWGRIDNNQGGMLIEEMPQENIFFDENKSPRYLTKPTQIPNLNGVWVATGNDTCIVVDAKGKAYSWGFSCNYQTGQGTEDDIVEATQIDNTAVRDQHLTFAGVGGQFGVLGGYSLSPRSGN
ncbi:Protein pim1 [Golovinomyces cichoracearum]|uniref:Protein pim1 n=1 Tax=Golovinomyces cichoracearum TaxID=62708 RepID=A0A420HSG1_9PEZI|nr:Protein pim1 [Golovinomyces cichoracearum]